MEHFEPQEPGVKSKSVYSLHLDTPRIILITSVLLFVIAGSFLVGMNLMKGDDQSESLRVSDSTQRPLLAGSTESTVKEPVAVLPEDSISKEKNNDVVDAANPDGGTNKKVNLITSSDLPAVKEQKKEKQDVVITAKPGKKIAKRKEPKIHRKVEKKKTHRKKRTSVVAVSAHPVKSKHFTGSYFAIQIASYDNKTKARKEMAKLKKMKYDAFMDKTSVNGKSYYRVRIGPIKSKSDAISALNEIQGIERYQESYMVRESR
jgi:cell division septation protein DedD